MGSKDTWSMNEKEAFLQILELSSLREATYFYKQFQILEKKKSILFYIEDLLEEEKELFFYYIKVLNFLGLYPIFISSKKLEEYFIEKLGNIKVYNNIDKNVDFLTKVNHCFILENTLSDSEIINQLYNFCSFFKSFKLVFFDRIGCILNDLGKKISLIHLLKDNQILIEKKSLRTFLICKSLINLNSNLNISVTSPLNFAKELFTVKGKGTLIRKGSEIVLLNSLDENEKLKVKILVEDAFQKKLKLNFFEQKMIIFLEENYRGCAIVIKTSLGYYLSKFAVNFSARGDGIGIQIWKKLKENCSSLFWRSNKNNLINQRYIDECDGFQRSQNWQYFWFGISEENIIEIISFMKKVEIDFLIDV